MSLVIGTIRNYAVFGLIAWAIYKIMGG